MVIKYYLRVLLLVGLVGCNSECNPAEVDILDEVLPVAILDESYQHQFSVEIEGLADFKESGFEIQSSLLPPGIDYQGDAIIKGKPNSTGVYEFQAYYVHEGVYYDFIGEIIEGFVSPRDDPYNDYVEIETEDRASFTLVVTRNSTNSDCPSPAKKESSDNQICIGKIVKDKVLAGDPAAVDVTLILNTSEKEIIEIDGLGITITYNADVLEIKESQITTQLLGAAGKFGEATLRIENPEPGKTTFFLTARNRGFIYPGRLFTLPFSAKTDLTSQTLDLNASVEVLSYATAQEDKSPSFIVKNGAIKVD